MSSSLLPWDLLKRYPHIVDNNERGFFLFLCEDAFLERILVNKVSRGSMSGKLRVISGAELTIDWIEENLLSLDLFEIEKHYMVLQSEKISAKVTNYLLENKIELTSKLFFMIFNKENDFFKKFSVEHRNVKVKRPMFWEMGALLHFLERELGVKIPSHVHHYILDFVSNDTGSFIQALKNISLNFPLPLIKGLTNDELIEKMRSVIEEGHLNKFVLASWFSQKEKKKFFADVLERKLDFDTLRELFSFMQGHLYKLHDLTYMERKKSLSKYDREIREHSKNWSVKEIRSEMRFFGELEILAKRKSDDLLNQLRGRYLRYI